MINPIDVCFIACMTFAIGIFAGIVITKINNTKSK